MQPTYVINHGGGPCFFLKPGPMRDAWSEREACLRAFADTLDERQRAILVVSGHREERRPTVDAGARPSLLFDHGGFPAHAYELTWPAPGAPELAARVRDLLGAAGLESGADTARLGPRRLRTDEDHVPRCRHPSRPVVAPAWARSRSALGHGPRSAATPGEGVLILGSGQAYHDMRGFMGGREQVDSAAEALDARLRDAMADGETRDRSLVAWERAPGAPQAQPHEDLCCR